MADHPGTMVATDVHQHLWPEGFLAALRARADAPAVRRDGRGWLIRVPGEPDSPFGPATHDPLVRAADLRATGLERALLCMSTPLGIEALAEDEARPLLDAWHDGVFAAGDAFGVWGALPVHGARPDRRRRAAWRAAPSASRCRPPRWPRRPRSRRPGRCSLASRRAARRCSSTRARSVLRPLRAKTPAPRGGRR